MDLTHSFERMVENEEDAREFGQDVKKLINAFQESFGDDE